VIDLARDGGADYFTRDEIAALQAAGKTVLAYIEIAAIAEQRPEYPSVPRDLILNSWPGWPGEYFVQYWNERWWEVALHPRITQALAAGFDGLYLDATVAYAEIDLELLRGETRVSLGRAMVGLIARISSYAKLQNPEFIIVPQNAPELRGYPGYIEAIDGIGMEELFFLATDQPCDADWCEENLEHVRALRNAGKLVLAVDYADASENRAAACARYAEEGFAGYVGPVELNELRPPCP